MLAASLCVILPMPIPVWLILTFILNRLALCPTIAQILPGSHKSSVGVPPTGSAYQSGPSVEPQGLVQPVMEAGDLLFFMGNATTHGSRPWVHGQERRVVLSSYQSRNLDFPSPQHARSRAFRHPLLAPPRNAACL